MTDFTIWAIILLASLGTFALRASFTLLLGKKKMPRWFEQALKFVPVAVLTALILPSFLLKNGQIAISVSNERFLAGIVAVIAAVATKNMLWTIAAGMTALWILQAVMG